MSASDGNTAELWVPTGSVTVRVPGKVNLYLAVGDRREDGYHELTTVFHAVSLVDEVTVRNADVLSLELVGEGADQLPTDERNLAWQAAELMAEHVGRAPDVSIMIDKSIPVAGGMAGGSADAAAVLVAMNSLWELNVPRRDLRMLAARLGSDVPFALHGGTALGTGRGEELATVLSRNTFHWVLAFADSGLLTSAVYNELDRLREVGDPPRLGEPGPVLAALAAGDPDQLAPLLGNEMQAAAATEAIAEGFTHVNLDLIYGTPGESDDDLVRSVDATVQAGVDHVSAYALVVEHGTALARRVRRGELAAPDDDVLAHRYELVDARLSAAGFAWYEVSNWCRPGGECRHNLGYWDGGQWWGAGPGAHGYIGVTRWWNVKHPNTYAEILAGATLPVAGFEQLGADALHTEDVLLKVRLRQGLPLARLGAAERERAEAVLADGLLDYHGDRLVLTGRGRLLADAVVRTLLG